MLASSNDSSRRSVAESFLLMGTTVTVRVVGSKPAQAIRESIDDAERAMRSVEETLTRFDEGSALRQLCRTVGVSTPVPPALFYSLKVAVEVAELTGGAFDPTIGRRMEAMGFNRHYLTGEEVQSGDDEGASYRDITLVDEGFRVHLKRPMALDLGAVGKGLAIDVAARMLEQWDGCAIDAGGDVYVSGVDPQGGPWSVGIEDPRDDDVLLRRLSLTDAAVCTSGSYKRRSSVEPGDHHLVDARTGRSVQNLLSCTVIGPQAMMADVVATAAFLLGADGALPFIEGQGLTGLCVTETGAVLQSEGMEALLSDGR